ISIFRGWQRPQHDAADVRERVGRAFTRGRCPPGSSFCMTRRMKLRVAPIAVLLAACAAPPPPPKVVPQVARPTNALTPVATVTKTIVDPRIRVGMLSDQTSVTFPRIDGGYYLIGGSGAASILRRGFTDAAPLTATTIRYSVQAGAISDKPSADTFAARLRSETGQRVEAIF